MQKGAAITGESCETDSDSGKGRGEEGERQTGRQTRLTGRAGTADSEAAKGICLCGMQQGEWEGRGMCRERGWGVVCMAKESQPGTGS